MAVASSGRQLHFKAAAQNFGLDDNPSHSERYRRAAEFTDVSIRLWDSWEDGAELGDKAAGVAAATRPRTPIATRRDNG